MGIVSQIRRKVRNIWADLQYGAILKGNIVTRYSNLGAHDIVNSDYDVLRALFASHVRSDDALVDVGCGKGRVLNFWLDQYPHHQIYGIELDPAIAEQTRIRLSRFENVKVITGDACKLLPAEGSFLYLFNPFDGEVMKRMIATLIKSPRATNGLSRRIIYYNCVYISLFASDPHFVVTELGSYYNNYDGNYQGALIDCS